MSRHLLLVVMLALGAGCMPRVPKQRLDARAKVAVAYIVDPAGLGDARTAPDALKAAVNAELDSRNLEVVEVALETVALQRLTDARFEALKAAAGDSPYLLLVEQRVQFFSQLDGRYRWEVSTNLTAARTSGAGAKDPFEIPVILMYDHERDDDAIAAAASDVANRVGGLLDGVLVRPRVSGEGAVPTTTVAPTTPVVAPVTTRAPAALPGAIYLVMVDRFANGDRGNDADANPADPQGFHGGDLAGLISRLDWVKSLGFDTVWLTPIFAMRTAKWNGYGAFHGYWTYDFGKVEPRFGDEALVRKLRVELDKRDMKLVLDLVLNHVGYEAPLLTQHPDWFHKLGPIADWNDPVQLTSRDVHGLPDLATEREDVFASLESATRRWL
jgi:hypothetical protein